MVDHADKRYAFSSGGTLEHLEVAHREAVHPDELSLVDAGNRAYVPELVMVRLAEIDKEGTGGADSERATVYGKAFQGLCPELAAEPLDGGLVDEGPFLDGGNVCPFSVLGDGNLLAASLDKPLFRGEIAQERADV